MIFSSGTGAPFSCLLLLTTTLQFAKVSQAQEHKTFILGMPGMSAPGGSDTFDNLGSFAISERGAVFRAYLSNAKVSAIYSVSAKGTREVLRPGAVMPGYGTITGSLGNLRANNSAETAVSVVIEDVNLVTRNALVAGNSATNRRVVVIADQPVPDGNGQFNSYSEGVINDDGEVAFWGAIKNGGAPLSESNGIFIGHADGSMTQVMRSKQLAPGESYPISSMSSSPILKENGQVCFAAWIKDPYYGTGNNSAIYRRKSSGAVVRVARSRQPATGTSRYFAYALPGGMNDKGETAFYAPLIDGSGAAAGASIFKGKDEASLTPIAYTQQQVPDGYGVYTVLDNSVGINASGEVAFVGYYSGNGTGAGSGVFVGDGTTQTNVIRSGQTAPGGNTFTGFAMPRVNDNGAVLFAGQLNGHQTYQGIYLSDGEDTIKVAQAGDTVDGKTIETVGMDPKAFNGFQQVAYQAKFVGQSGYSALLFAPRLKWRGGSGGWWGDAAKWTARLIPAEYNDVDIIPDDPVQILGPLEDIRIASLRIGNTNAQSGTTDFKLRSGVVAATGGVLIMSGGSVSGVGTIDGDVTNAAELSPGNSPGLIKVGGNYLQLSTGTLTMEIGGVLAGQHDSLQVTGNVTLAGRLNVVVLGEALRTMTGREHLQVTTSNGLVSGSFSNLVSGSRIFTADGMASFLVTITGTDVTLSDFKPVDTDGDGLPDYWMKEHFGKTTSSAEDKSLPALDADGDGVLNADEYLTGTKPKDNTSVLRADIAHDASGGVLVTFVSVAGRTYKIQSSIDLKSWGDVQTGIAGDGETKTFNMGAPASGVTSRFYRVTAEW